MLMGEYDYTLYFVSDQTTDGVTVEPPFMAKVGGLFYILLTVWPIIDCSFCCL